MDNAISEIIANAMMDLKKKKRDYIQKVINDKINVHYNLSEDIERLFPKVKCIECDGFESWYYDNGTKEGKLICVISSVIAKNEKGLLNLSFEVQPLI